MSKALKRLSISFLDYSIIRINRIFRCRRQIHDNTQPKLSRILREQGFGVIDHLFTSTIKLTTIHQILINLNGLDSLIPRSVDELKHIRIINILSRIYHSISDHDLDSPDKFIICHFFGSELIVSC